MKILYVSPYPPARDGIGNYTRILAASAIMEGHDVRVVVPQTMPHYPDEVFGTISRRQRDQMDLCDTIADWGPDVVHVQFAVAAFASRTGRLIRWLTMLRHRSAVPVVVTMHEVTRDIALLRAFGVRLYRKLITSCDDIIVHTQSGMRLLTGSLSAPAATVHIIPHPTTCPSQETATAHDVRIRFGLGSARLLLAFGFIHVDKGLYDLVRALAILHSSTASPLSDVRLVVAGTVRPRQGIFRCFELRDRLHLRRVQRLIRRSRIHQYVVFTGYVPDGEIAAWFLAAEAVVLPYRRADQSGVAGLANAFGALVLASTVGGLGEQFCDSARTFAPGDPNGIARVLDDFLSAPSPELLERPVAMRVDDVKAVSASTQAVYRAAVNRYARRVSSASRD